MDDHLISRLSKQSLVAALILTHCSVSMCDYGHFTKPKEKKVYLEATQHLHTGRPQLDGGFHAVKPSSLKPHGVEV